MNQHPTESPAQVVGMLSIVLGALVIAGLLAHWRYSECLEVGHSATYCVARSLGCVDR